MMQLNLETLSLIANFAQLASTLFAGYGLILAAKSFRQQTTAADFASVSLFFEKSVVHEQNLHSAVGKAEEFQRKFADYVNHLEILAFSLNKGLYGPRVAALITRKLIEDLAIIDSIPNAGKLVDELIDGPNTFSDISLFLRQNRKEFKQAKDRRWAAPYSSDVS